MISVDILYEILLYTEICEFLRLSKLLFSFWETDNYLWLKRCEIDYPEYTDQFRQDDNISRYETYKNVQKTFLIDVKNKLNVFRLIDTHEINIDHLKLRLENNEQI